MLTKSMDFNQFSNTCTCPHSPLIILNFVNKTGENSTAIESVGQIAIYTPT